MKCDKCKSNFLEKDIEEHHQHPRFMDNKKGKGIKDYLCKKDHDILHKIMLKWLWDWVPEISRTCCIEDIKLRSKKFIKNGDTTTTTQRGN